MYDAEAGCIHPRTHPDPVVSICQACTEEIHNKRIHRATFLGGPGF